MKRFLPFTIAIVLTGIFFWQFFVKGYIPIPASYMVSWYEPWKTNYSVNGVPSIPHKAVGDDTFRQLYPFKMLAADFFYKLELPLWNPYNGAGQPLLANLHPGYFNPLSLVLLLGTKQAWAWYIMMHLGILFLSTYLYVRTLRVSQWAAVVSATVFSLSGAVVTRYIFGEFLFSLATLPILLFLIEKMRVKNIWMLLIPLVTVLTLVTVQPQISLYILTTVVIYTFMRIPRHPWLVLTMMALGVGLSAFQLIPTIELFTLANVNAGSSSFIFQKFLMPISHLFSLIIPNYFGNSGTYNFWGKTDYVETVMSIGMIPVALAFFAKKGKVKTFFVWGAIITIVLTLDWIVPRLLYQIPIPILSTSVPTRLYLITMFFIAVLSGLGADSKPSRRTLIGLGILAVGAIIASRFFNCPTQIPQCRGVAIRNSIFELGVFTIGSIILFLPEGIKKIGITLLLITVGLYNGWKFLPMSPSEYVAKNHPLFDVLRQNNPARAVGLGSASFATDFATQYRYFDLNYYDPLYIRRYGEIVSYVNTGNRYNGLTRSDVQVVSDTKVDQDLSFRRQRFWDMMGATELVAKKEDGLIVAGEPLWQDDHWMIFRRSSALPRAFVVTDVRTIPHEGALLTQLFLPETDVSTTAFVEKPVEGVDIGKKPAAYVSIVQYKANEVTISVDTDTSAFLVVSDTYYPGWKATVDGKETEIYRTNYAFRGISVPQGKHVVVFIYQSNTFKFGLIFTSLSLLVWIFYCWYNRSKKGLRK